MHYMFSLLAVAALAQQVLSAPTAPEAPQLEKRVLYTSYCYQDNLYRSFTDPRYSSSASAFCSTYIRPTFSATAISTSTTVATVTGVVIVNQKRDATASFTTFPASRLSSACSCILTSAAATTTVYPTTVVVPASPTTTVVQTTTIPKSTSTSSTTSTLSTTSAPSTTSVSSTTSVPSTTSIPPTTSAPSTTSATSTTTTSNALCAVATPIQNGNFESGSLAPWTVVNVYPGSYDAQYYNYGVTKNGDNSVYAFTVNDEAVDSYFNVGLAQTLTTCPSVQYNFSARYFMTDAYDGPQTSVTVTVDGSRIAVSNINDAHTPARYVNISGTFTAKGNTASLVVSFTATDYLECSWGLDNVQVTPA